jgi:hypothetical protein
MSRKRKSRSFVSDKSPLIKFSDDFWIMLDRLSQTQNSEIAWSLYELDSNPYIQNIMRISGMDVSDKPNKFIATISSHKVNLDIDKFLKSYFGKEFSDESIKRFIFAYNRLISGQNATKSVDFKSVELKEFRFNPSDIKSTFLSLVTETYPHGHEEEVVKFLPQFLKRDSFGNYYHIIGESDTSFTSHLDTASFVKSEINLIEFEKDGELFIKTDGRSILGADDKSGVTILLYLIHNNIPGVYWFFIGEERGGIGSRKVVTNYDKYPFMKNIKKMVSFDRRNYYSVITNQGGVECCSNEFAKSLCDELNRGGLKLGLDPTGVFTDSANFIDVIPECTNISVGYFDEHRNTEMQNISYLEKLCKSVVSCDWNKLEIKRKIYSDIELNDSLKYRKMIIDVRKIYTFNKISIKNEDGKLVFLIDVTEGQLDKFYQDMNKLDRLFLMYRQQPNISFIENMIKIKFE